jgi:RNA polymerase sigma factor (sigma-70 family)
MRHKRITKLYEEKKHMFYTYALGLTNCPAKAEDAVHTAISKLLSAIVLPRDLEPYAYRCIRNAAIDDWRKYAARATEPLEEQQITSNASHTQDSQDLISLLNHLTPEERETIVLKVLHGFTFREIATISRSSINTISSQYRRTLQKLKTLYEEDNNE